MSAKTEAEAAASLDELNQVLLRVNWQLKAALRKLNKCVALAAKNNAGLEAVLDDLERQLIPPQRPRLSVVEDDDA